MSISALSPLRYRLLDGEEREFLLTFRSLRAAQPLMAALSPDDRLGIASTMLYVALQGNHGMTQEQFEDLLPLDIEGLSAFLTRLMQHSGVNPTVAETAPEVTPIRSKAPKKVS